MVMDCLHNKYEVLDKDKFSQYQPYSVAINNASDQTSSLGILQI